MDQRGFLDCIAFLLIKNQQVLAEKRKLTVFGTLRVLADASPQGLLVLPQVLDRLMRTNFRATEQLMRHLRALSGD